jgi:hypothetical protein
MVGLLYLLSQYAKLHVAGWTWAVFKRVCLESCISLSPQSGNFWVHPRISLNKRLALKVVFGCVLCEVCTDILYIIYTNASLKIYKRNVFCADSDSEVLGSVPDCRGKAGLVDWWVDSSRQSLVLLINMTLLQGAAEIVKHFNTLVTCFSARVLRNAGILT